MRKRSGKAGLRTKQSSKRRWITFTRILRYGGSNFVRNAWLSIASALIMTITLLIILIALLASNTLTSTVDALRKEVKMSIYVMNTIDDASVRSIKADLEKLESVSAVEYVSASEIKQNEVKRNIDNPETIKAYNLATNKFPATFNIEVKDINDPSELERFVEENKTYKKFASGDAPSFSSERREAIDKIARASRFIERFGLLAIGIFLVIAILVVFNTIRMAIFNRKSEIYMMRLIGAEPSFIRGPFIVEAILTGVIAGVIATVILLVLLSLINREKMLNYGIMIDQALELMQTYWLVILVGSMILGALIASISSIFATRKYLVDQPK